MFDMGEQLAHWQGQVGDAYRERNSDATEHGPVTPYYKRVADDRQIKSILEVGCNIGLKIKNWMSVFEEKEKPRICGLEPNEISAGLARNVSGVDEVKVGDAYSIPYADAEFDLVFTSGVLMHIPPEMIAKAASEVARVAKRYVLAVEYYTPAEQEMRPAFRGVPHMWWSRDYKTLYESNGLALLYCEPYMQERKGFENVFLWMFGKDGAR